MYKAMYTMDSVPSGGRPVQRLKEREKLRLPTINHNNIDPDARRGVAFTKTC